MESEVFTEFKSLYIKKNGYSSGNLNIDFDYEYDTASGSYSLYTDDSSDPSGCGYIEVYCGTEVIRWDYKIKKNDKLEISGM